MIDVLSTLLAFIVALSVLIAAHEFGHFWVARRMGVKVLRFSIGFGKPIWSRRGKVDGTEYVIASLPLGGYVKMVDEREGEVAAEDLPRAFNRQTVGKRFAIVAAGPVFNLVFAVAAYWLMFVLGVPGVKPVLGEIPPDTPAYAAGLRNGQEVLQANGQPTPTWTSFMEAMLPSTLTRDPVELTVRDEGRVFDTRIVLSNLPEEARPEDLLSRIGLAPFRPPLAPIIDEITANSPAERAGLRKGDRVSSVAGKEVDQWETFVGVVRDNPGRPLAVTVIRDGQPVRVEVRPDRVESGNGPVGRIGAGVQVDPALFDAYRAELRYGAFAAIGAAVEKTWSMSVLTLRMLGEMVVGRASVENISGPITIARYAKTSADAGLTPFLSFLAIVSLSLAVLNLLPVPVLDGGHLMFYLVEMVKGSPVSERTEIIGQKIGLAVILALMILAFYNDLARLAG